MRLALVLGCLTWFVSSEDPSLQVSLGQSVWDSWSSSTQSLLLSNQREVSSWVPRSNASKKKKKRKRESSLLSPEDAALQRRWHQWNSELALSGAVDSGRLMISFCLSPLISGVSSNNELHSSAILGDLSKMQKVLSDPDLPIDVDSETSDGVTALMLASMMNRTDIVEYLLDQGALPDLVSSQCSLSALQWACLMNHSEVAKLLLTRSDPSANPDYPHSFAGSTALHFAVEMGNIECIKVLCQHGANSNAAKHDGGTPLHIAADIGQYDSARVLLEECPRIDIEAKLMNDTTPMYLAALNGHDKVVKLLIDHNAISDLAMPSVARMDVAKSYGSNGMIDDKYGLSYGRINQELGNGATPLHAAVENGHYKVAQVLLEDGHSRQVS